uniref:Uncharacterized protein n=1 Tax=Panagrolaimus sp. JU765 TaxID=591449 RepID=A0AC34PX35_9BILA
MNKFVEFNHFELVFEVGILQRFPQLFTPNIKIVVFANEGREPTEDNYDDYNFEIVFQHLPNVEKIRFYYFEMSKLFVKINRDFGPKLTEMRFYFRSKDENYDLLAEMMRKQSSNACFNVDYFWAEQRDDPSIPSRWNVRMKKLLLYFERIAKPMSIRAGLTLSYDDVYHFVLRDFAGISDGKLNANYYHNTDQEKPKIWCLFF